MVAPADFSALYCPPRHREPPPTEKTVLSGWNVEDAAHACFDPAEGEYIVATEGLYSLVIELIPIGNARLEHEQTRRVHVEYALRIQEPPPDNPGTDDDVESEYLDVGSVNLRQVKHLKEGSVLTCLRMPAATGHNCVRMKIDCLQRKKKRPRAPELSKKELKKRKKMKRKAESSSSASSGRHPKAQPPFHGSSDTSRWHDSSDNDDDESDSQWFAGFESDTTEDDLHYSKTDVARLTDGFAKRFKGPDGTEFNS